MRASDDESVIREYLSSFSIPYLLVYASSSYDGVNCAKMKMNKKRKEPLFVKGVLC